MSITWCSVLVLYTSIGADALEALIGSSNDVNHLEFEYAGYMVLVEDEDNVYLDFA